jgi:Ca2+-binding EF-hand superfamily protein
MLTGLFLPVIIHYIWCIFQTPERLPCDLEVYDTDEDGEVSREEFLVVAHNHGHTEDNLVHQAFAIADTDGIFHMIDTLHYIGLYF